MDDDPKKEALLIMGKMKPKGDAMDEGDDEGGMDAASALKDMYHSMREGDFDSAAHALKAAMMACEDDA